MRWRVALVLAGVLFLPGFLAAQVPEGATSMLQDYCIRCHNERMQSGAMMLDRINMQDVRVDAEVWERILRRLRSRTMPPPGRTPRPAAAQYDAVISSLATQLNKLAVPLKPSERISSAELANRMAALLWGNPPDDLLLAAAKRGDLRTNTGIEKQVARMIADPQSRKFVSDFIEKWLHLDLVGRVYIQADTFAQFPGNINTDMQRELSLFIDSQFRENHPLSELINANYTFVNANLAQLYGLPGITSSQFARVNLPDDRRAGLLGMAGFLTMTSLPIRTSATYRAKWLYAVFLGAPPPAPPPNLPSVSTFKSHRELDAAYFQGSCRSCHFISQLGGPLENFDEIGRWRSTELGEPVDASGMLPDGTIVSGPVELRQGLMKYKETFVSTMMERLMAYALRRDLYVGPVYWQEMPAVRGAIRAASAKDYRWAALLSGIIESAPFQSKKVLP